MAYAHPVIANGRLYIHDLGTLWSYDIKDKQYILFMALILHDDLLS